MIHYKPGELPELWNKIKGTDGTRVVAVDDEVIIQFYDSGGSPTFLISYDNEPIDEVTAEPGELVEVAKSMYHLYICEESGEHPLITVTADPPEKPDAEESEHVLSPLELDHEEEINENEVNLYQAVVNFLHAVLDIDPVTIMSEHEDVVEDFTEHALKYLYLRHGFDIYRPMVLEMDDGAEVYKDFPYSLLDLSEEEANPVFMPG